MSKDMQMHYSRLQDKSGFFPAWLDPATLQPLPHLKQSPETSLSVTFLFMVYDITKNPVYKNAGLKSYGL